MDGIITFVPQNGTSGFVVGTKIINGNYKIRQSDGPVIGLYNVQISSIQKTGKKIEDTSMSGLITDEMKETIPEKYNRQTTLAIEIKTGNNILDFDLKP
jgi:hypothetical protein